MAGKEIANTNTVKMEREIISVDDISVGIVMYPYNSFKSFAYYDSQTLFFSINIGDIYLKEGSEVEIDDSIIMEAILEKLEIIRKDYTNGIENSNLDEIFKNLREPDYAKQFEKLIETYEEELFEFFSIVELYNCAKGMYSKIDNYPEFQYGLVKVIEYFKENDDECISHIIEEDLSNQIKDNKILIYRGFNRENHSEGTSFTLNKDVASFFANRFGEGGYINQYEVTINDVIAYIEKEEEILTRKAKLIKENI